MRANHAYQCLGAARRGHRLRHARHHPGCGRATAGSGRRSVAWWPTPQAFAIRRDGIEAEGVRRARAHAAGDLTLLLLDGSADDCQEFALPTLLCATKADLPDFSLGDGISLSLKTGEGLLGLAPRPCYRKGAASSRRRGAPPPSRPRHRRELNEALPSCCSHGWSSHTNSLTAGRRSTPFLARLGPHHRPGRCRRAAGLRVPEFLHRQMMGGWHATISWFSAGKTGLLQHRVQQRPIRATMRWRPWRGVRPWATVTSGWAAMTPPSRGHR